MSQNFSKLRNSPKSVNSDFKICCLSQFKIKGPCVLCCMLSKEDGVNCEGASRSETPYVLILVANDFPHTHPLNDVEKRLEFGPSLSSKRVKNSEVENKNKIEFLKNFGPGMP